MLFKDINVPLKEASVPHNNIRRHADELVPFVPLGLVCASPFKQNNGMVLRHLAERVEPLELGSGSSQTVKVRMTLL